MTVLVKLTTTLAAFSAIVNAALVRVSDFGSNPTNLQMNIWVPTNVAAKPAIILAVSVYLQATIHGRFVA